MFQKFYNRIELQATIVADTALYIGAGEASFDPGAIQGALLKNAL